MKTNAVETLHHDQQQVQSSAVAKQWQLEEVKQHKWSLTWQRANSQNRFDSTSLRITQGTIFDSQALPAHWCTAHVAHNIRQQ